MSRDTLLRGGAFLLVVFAVAFAGMWAGQEFRERRAETGTDLETDLVAGAAFPAEPVTAADGTIADTAELTRDGAVVVFMRFDCPACGMTVDRWRDEVADGPLAAVPVVGITTDPPGAIAGYREAKAVPFPVYSDPDRTFAREHGVSSVPFVVVVGPGGTIRESALGFRPDADFERMRELAGG